MKPDAQSERIRLSLGILTLTERQTRENAERKRKEAKAKKAAMGSPLFTEIEINIPRMSLEKGIE